MDQILRQTARKAVSNDLTMDNRHGLGWRSKSVEFAIRELKHWLSNKRLLLPAGAIAPTKADARFSALCFPTGSTRHGSIAQTK